MGWSRFSKKILTPRIYGSRSFSGAGPHRTSPVQISNLADHPHHGHNDQHHTIGQISDVCGGLPHDEARHVSDQGLFSHLEDPPTMLAMIRPWSWFDRTDRSGRTPDSFNSWPILKTPWVRESSGDAGKIPMRSVFLKRESVFHKLFELFLLKRHILLPEGRRFYKEWWKKAPAPTWWFPPRNNFPIFCFLISVYMSKLFQKTYSFMYKLSTWSDASTVHNHKLPLHIII